MTKATATTCRRILLILVITLIAATGLVFGADEPDKYSLWVGDTQVTSENAENITFSDPVQASYDAASNTLTLNNYTYEGYGCDNDDVKAAIKARMGDDFTINLIGDNTVKHVYKETSAGAGIYADNNMTITGDGTLTVSDGDNADNYNSRGIRVGQELTIGSGAAVNASSGKGQNSYGVNVKNLTVQGELNAVGGSAKNSYGAYTSNNVTVSKDGALNATGGTATKDSFGVFIYNKSPSMTIEGAMTARGNTFAIAKAADPNPSINTAAIQISEDDLAEGYIAIESVNYDGSNATQVAAGGKTSETAKYIRIGPFMQVTAPAGKTLTYNGKAQTGVAAAAGYTLSGATAANAGSYQATATLDAGYKWDDGTDEPKTIDWTIAKAAANVTAPTGKTITYNGNAQTGVEIGKGYTLSGTTKATDAGNYTATATLKTDTNYTYKWSDGTTAAKTIVWTINKAANPLKIKAKTATVKFSKVKKKNQKLAVTKVIKFTNKGQGSKTYVKKSGNKKITIAKKTGKVTVKKGLKKGTYKVKVKVKAAGNANYNPSAWKVVTFKIIVK